MKVEDMELGEGIFFFPMQLWKKEEEKYLELVGWGC